MFENFFKSQQWEGTRNILTIFLVIAAAFLVVLNVDTIVAALLAIWDACLPFIVGGAIAYVLNLLMVKLEKIYFPKSDSLIVAKTRRPVSLLLAIVIIAAIVSLVSYLVASEISAALIAIGEGFSAIINMARDFIPEDSYWYGVITGEPDVLSDYIQNLITTIGGSNSIATSLTNVGSNLASSTLSAIVAFVFSIYVLLDKDRVLKSLNNAVVLLSPRRHYPYVTHVLRIANVCFGRFVYGQCIEACVIGTLCGIGLALFGFPFAAPIGFIVGITSLVPFVGAWVGGIIGAFMILSVSPQQTVMFIIFLVVLQQIESNVIYPRVVGTTVGVPGILVLVSVFIGGSLFGVAGVLCAVPVVSTARTLIAEKKENDERWVSSVEEDDFMVNMREVAASSTSTFSAPASSVSTPSPTPVPTPASTPAPAQTPLDEDD